MASPSSRDAARAEGDLRFVVVGAGMSGILSGVELSKAGFDDWVVYEKADRLGGTWRENVYSGIACDVPSHLYSYSFALNPEWSHRFSPGAEICAYLEGVAERFGVAERIRYGREIVRCAFEGGRWKLAMADGSTDEADFVIAATGVLHHPKWPELEGLDRFAGELFHSACWPSDLRLGGRRVGVIGTGSSAVQICGAVVDEVEELVLFQRTPQWIMPIENPAYSEAEKAGFRAHPEAMRAIRDEVSRQYVDGFANILIDVESPVLRAMQTLCERNLEESVEDPTLRERLRPDYRAGCKRLVLSGNFYDAIQHPNARLVTAAIERVEEGGVRTADGSLHALDVLVLATGFQVDRFMRPMEVVGRGGVRLDDVWKDSPTAYLAISVPDFPNLFMLNGPNGPVGNFSLIEVAELQFAYILELVERVRAGGRREISVSHDAMKRFDDERREAARTTIWASGCHSWYIDSTGLPMAWPFTYDRFRLEMAEPRFEDYELR